MVYPGPPTRNNGYPRVIHVLLKCTNSPIFVIVTEITEDTTKKRGHPQTPYELRVWGHFCQTMDQDWKRRPGAY